jgi:hypothetical protein
MYIEEQQNCRNNFLKKEEQDQTSQGTKIKIKEQKNS